MQGKETIFFGMNGKFNDKGMKNILLHVYCIIDTWNNYLHCRSIIISLSKLLNYICSKVEWNIILIFIIIMHLKIFYSTTSRKTFSPVYAADANVYMPSYHSVDLCRPCVLCTFVLAHTFECI